MARQKMPARAPLLNSDDPVMGMLAVVPRVPIESFESAETVSADDAPEIVEQPGKKKGRAASSDKAWVSIPTRFTARLNVRFLPETIEKLEAEVYRRRLAGDKTTLTEVIRSLVEESVVGMEHGTQRMAARLSDHR